MSTVSEPAWVRRSLIFATVAIVGLFVVGPVVVVFAGALSSGVAAYLQALREPDTAAAVRLTVRVALWVVPANTLFGLAAAWLLAKYRFFGRSLLTVLIELPLGVSPVISGLIFVLLFGRQGLLGSYLDAHDYKVIFALPGIALATAFVTLPLVARELLIVLTSQGSGEQEAALTLGASGWRIFFEVTLPKARWGLLYGIILCSARAMGEFGAVSVVSGHIRGETNTLPLEIENLYSEYNLSAAFAVASLLTLVAVFTLFAKQLIAHGSTSGGRP